MGIRAHGLRHPTLWVGLAYLILAIFWTAPSSFEPWNRVPNLGDPLATAWTLAWDAHALRTAPLSLFDSNAFYPYSQSLIFSDHYLPEAMLVAPVFWLTGNAVLTQNVAVVLGLFLSALWMFALVHEITGSRSAAFLSGLVYAFNSFTFQELPRVHVVHIQWWPLGLLFLSRFFRDLRPKDALLAVAALAIQGLSGTYYLYYSSLLVPLWLIILWWRGAPKRPGLVPLAVLASGFLTAAAATLLFLWPYVHQHRALDLSRHFNEALLELPEERRSSLFEQGFEEGFVPGADLLSFLNPDSQNILWGSFHIEAVNAELSHFLGFVSLVLIVAGVVSVRRAEQSAQAIALIAIGTAIFGALMSLGFELRLGGTTLSKGPYSLVYHYLPFARGMASPERAGVLVYFGGAILVGLGASRLLAHLPRRILMPATIALMCALVFDHWSPPARGSAVPVGDEIPSVYRWLDDGSGRPTVELPLYHLRDRRLWSAYFYFSTYHWRPVPFGRQSFYPPAHDLLAWSCRDFPLGTCIPLLQKLGIKDIVVHPLVWPESVRKARLASLDLDTRLSLVKKFDEHSTDRFAALKLGRERVYHLAPPRGNELGHVCKPTDEIPRDAWELTSGNGLTPPELVRDGDRSTAWYTLMPQIPGFYLGVRLAREETIAAATLDIANPYETFPRGLSILIPRGEGWQNIPYRDDAAHRWATVEQLLYRPKEARSVLPFAPVRTSQLMLVLTHDREWAHPRWSVPELRLFRRCE